MIANAKHTGAMIALTVPDPENYAITPPTENSLSANDLHITIAYLGKASEIEPAEREAILEACQILADTSDAPESLFPASTGVFPPDPESPDPDAKAAYYAAPAHPERFSLLREDLMTHLSARGVAEFVSTKHPVFTPHVTLTYEDLETPPSLNLPTPIPVVFPTLICKFGDEVHTFTLRSEAAGPELPITASVQSTLSQVAKNYHRSEEYVTALYLRQNQVVATPARTRSQAAIDAVLSTLDSSHKTQAFARAVTLAERTAITASAEERSYLAGRALAIVSRTKATTSQEARELGALTEQIMTIIADGNSSAARSARARAQLRDRYGRWIYMGGGLRYKIRKPGTPGGGEWVHGVARGIDAATGRVQMELEDGSVVSVPANKVEQTKATLGQKIKGAYRAFKPRTQGRIGQATPDDERATLERNSNVESKDETALPAIDRLRTTTKRNADREPNGGNVIRLMNDNREAIMKASLAGEDSVAVTGTQAPFKDKTSNINVKDAMAVLDALEARKRPIEGFDEMDEAQQKRELGKQSGAAIASLTGAYNDKDDADASELRRAPSIGEDDIQSITADEISAPTENAVTDKNEMIDLANDALNALSERIPDGHELSGARDQIKAALDKANASLDSDDITVGEYLNTLDAIKEFAFAKGGEEDSVSEAFDAFSEDMDNVHAAAGGSDDFDLAKEVLNNFDDMLPETQNPVSDSVIDDFQTHMENIRSGIIDGSYLENPAKLAEDLQSIKDHFNSDSNVDNRSIASTIDVGFSNPILEKLDKTVEALKGNTPAEPYDSSDQPDPGFGPDNNRTVRLSPEERAARRERAAQRVVAPESTEDVEEPENPDNLPLDDAEAYYVPSTPELEDAIEYSDGFMGAVYDAMKKDEDGNPIFDFSNPESQAAYDSFNELMGEWYDSNFDEGSENLKNFKDKVSNAVGPLEKALKDEGIDKDQIDNVLNAASDFVESLTSATAAASRKEDGVDIEDVEAVEEVQAPNAPIGLAPFVELSRELNNILDEQTPSRELREEIEDLSNTVTNIGRDLDSSRISPSEAEALLTKAKDEFNLLYAEDVFGGELVGTDLGDELDAVFDGQFNDLLKKLSDERPTPSLIEEAAENRPDRPDERDPERDSGSLPPELEELLNNAPDEDLAKEMAPEAEEQRNDADDALARLREILNNNEATSDETYESVRDAQDALGRYEAKLEESSKGVEEGSDKEAFLEGEQERLASAVDALEEVVPEDAEPQPVDTNTLNQVIDDLRAQGSPVADAVAQSLEVRRDNNIPIMDVELDVFRDMIRQMAASPDATDEDKADALIVDDVLESAQELAPDDNFDPMSEYREAINNAQNSPQMLEAILQEINNDRDLLDIERKMLREQIDGLMGSTEESQSSLVDDYRAQIEAASANNDLDALNSIWDEAIEHPDMTPAEWDEIENIILPELRRLNEERENRENESPAAEQQDDPLADWERELLEEAPTPEQPDVPENNIDRVENDAANVRNAVANGQYNPLTDAQRGVINAGIKWMRDDQNNTMAAQLLEFALKEHDEGKILDYQLVAAIGDAYAHVNPGGNRNRFRGEAQNIVNNLGELQAALQQNMNRNDEDPDLPELSWRRLERQMQANEGLLDPINDDEVIDWLDRIPAMAVQGDRKRFERLDAVMQANDLLSQAKDAFFAGDNESAQQLIRDAVDAFDTALAERRGINMNDAFKRSLERRRRAAEALSARLDRREPRIAGNGNPVYTPGGWNRDLNATFLVGGRGANNRTLGTVRVGDTVVRMQNDENQGQIGIVLGFKGVRGLPGQTPQVEILVVGPDGGFRVMDVKASVIAKQEGGVAGFANANAEDVAANARRFNAPMGRRLQEHVAEAIRRNQNNAPEEPAAPIDSPIESRGSDALGGVAGSTPDRSAFSSAPSSIAEILSPEAVNSVSDEKKAAWESDGWGSRISDMEIAANNLVSADYLLDPNVSAADKSKAITHLLGLDGSRTFGNDGYTIQASSAVAMNGAGGYLRRFDGSQYFMVNGAINDSRGTKIGSISRFVEIKKNADGTNSIHIHNNYMEFPKKQHRGAGFSAAFNGQLEAWAAANHTGKDTGPLFTIQAALDTGAYVWSKAGFQFDSVQGGEGQVGRWITLLERSARGYPDDSLEMLQINALKQAHAEGKTILPADIMMVGFRPGMSDANNSMWLGKSTLLNNSNATGWYGVKDIRPNTLESAYRKRAAAEQKESAPNAERMSESRFKVGEELSDDLASSLIDTLRMISSNRPERSQYRPRDIAAINNVLLNNVSVSSLSAPIKKQLRADLKSMLKSDLPTEARVAATNLNRALYKDLAADTPAPTSLGVGDVLKNLEITGTNGATPRTHMMFRDGDTSFAAVIPEGFTAKANAAHGINSSTYMLTHTATGQKFMVKLDKYRRAQARDEAFANNANIEQGANNILRDSNFMGVNFVAPLETLDADGNTLPVIIQAMAGEHLGLDEPAITHGEFRTRNGWEAGNSPELADPTQWVDMLMFDMAVGHSDRHSGNFMIGQKNGENILLPIDNTLMWMSDSNHYQSIDDVSRWIGREGHSRTPYNIAAKLIEQFGEAGYKNMMMRALSEYRRAASDPTSQYANQNFLPAFLQNLDILETNLDEILKMLKRGF
ncbi:MAG: hypothetical protein E6R04_07335 [Spirochaetes bacterium]|nr:MAG: hypothetical protein E6R04_07335 [Spirochaetota bacterium]